MAGTPKMNIRTQVYGMFPEPPHRKTTFFVFLKTTFLKNHGSHFPDMMYKGHVINS